MRHLTWTLLVALTAFSAEPVAPLPVIKQNGAVKQLFVDGKPFTMLAGEMHNSTASSIEAIKPVFQNMAALHANTVIGTVSWELLEPEEGHFDYSLVDAQIKEARRHNLRLVLIWFGTYKTAHSSYVPAWVKADRRRFPPMVFQPKPDRNTLFPLGGLSVGEGGIGALTPFGEETLKADAKAFSAFMRHLREVDARHTVIMVQVENEPGSFGDSRDRSPLAEAAWAKPVPANLMNFLVAHHATLVPELREIWERNGSKTSGTWAEVFGGDERADEIFMGYAAGRFVGEVAKAGKRELNLPMFVNAFLVIPGLFPGQFPSGGPVHRLIDVYHAAAPAIDVLSPNAYAPDFKGVCALYARGGNPLLIPETGVQVGNLFWAVGHHAALAWSPFGALETMKPGGQLSEAFRLLTAVMPQLAKWQAEGKVDAILVADGEQSKPISLGGYEIGLRAPKHSGESNAEIDRRPFAIVVNTAPNEFLFLGANGAPKFAANVAIASKEEVTFNNGQWKPGRRFNGDEVDQGLPEAGIGMLRVKLLRFESLQ